MTDATPHRAASVYYVEVKGGRTVGGYNEPFEWYLPCGVFVAETPGQAKAMLIKEDGGLDLPDDFLSMRVRRLGTPNRREKAGYLGIRSRWWGRVPADVYEVAT